MLLRVKLRGTSGGKVPNTNLDKLNEYIERHRGYRREGELPPIPTPKKQIEGQYRVDKIYFRPTGGMHHKVTTVHNTLFEAVGRGLRPIPDLAFLTSQDHGGKVMVKRIKGGMLHVKSVKAPESSLSYQEREAAAVKHAKRVKAAINVVGWEALVEKSFKRILLK